MKIRTPILFGAIIVATLVTTQNLRADDLAHAAALASASTHRLIAASPHALEEFPWLLREPSPQTDPAVLSERALSAIKKNSAFAASPRVREQYAELDRSGWQSTIATAKTGGRERQLPSALKNRAWAASPRVKEEYPWLARGYSAPPTENPIQVAPLK
jgi:hypothetical protein